jgi:hypothetical protein
MSGKEKFGQRSIGLSPSGEFGHRGFFWNSSGGIVAFFFRKTRTSTANLPALRNGWIFTPREFIQPLMTTDKDELKYKAESRQIIGSAMNPCIETRGKMKLSVSISVHQWFKQKKLQVR